MARHAKRLMFQLADVIATRDMFGEILERMGGLRFAPG